MKPKVTVIIVSFNIKVLLKKCLFSLYNKNRGVNFEVIVIDNNSNDGTVEVLKEIRKIYTNTKIIINNENLGFAKACNQGIKEASGEYLLLLNPDIEIVENILLPLSEYMDKHKNIGVLGCKLIYPDGSVQSVGEKFISAYEVFKEQILFSKTLRKFLKRQNKTKRKFIEVDYVSGACLMVRKSIIESIGMLNEDYFMYGEDAEFCHRVKGAGWKIGVLLDVEIVHHHSKSSEQVLYTTLCHSIKNNLKNIKLLHDEKQVTLAVFFYVIGLMIRAVLAVFRPNRTSKDYIACIKKLLYSTFFRGGL